MLAHGLSPAFQDDVYILCRQPPLSQSRVNRVTHLHADGVHCREYAGTRPVNLKVVRVTGVVFLDITMDQMMRASPFPHQVIQKVLYQLNAHRPKVVLKKSSTNTKKASIEQATHSISHELNSLLNTVSSTTYSSQHAGVQSRRLRRGRG